MKAFLIGVAVTALSTGATFAQPAPPPPPGVAEGTAPLPPRMPEQRKVEVRVISDHVMTRDEVVAHVREMFGRLDTNHDGYVTREEANALMGHMDGMREQMESMRKHMDEMREHMKTMRVDIAQHFEGAHDPATMFDRLDTNHDGVISREEFMKGHKEMHESRMIVMRGPGDLPPMPAIPPVPAMPPMPPMADMGAMHMHAMMGGMGFASHFFDMADTNHDGRVSLQEAEAAALAHFDRADLNHDGRITPDERNQAREIRMERHPS